MSNNAYERKMTKRLDDISQAADAETKAQKIAAQTVDEYKAEKKKQGENK